MRDDAYTMLDMVENQYRFSEAEDGQRQIERLLCWDWQALEARCSFICQIAHRAAVKFWEAVAGLRWWCDQPILSQLCFYKLQRIMARNFFGPRYIGVGFVALTIHFQERCCLAALNHHHIGVDADE